MRNRRSKEGHEAVAEELIDRAFVAVYFSERRLEEGIEHRVHALGAETLGKHRGIADVAEQHSNGLPLALERAAGLEDLLDQMRRGIHKARGFITDRSVAREREAALATEVLPIRVRMTATAALHCRPFLHGASCRAYWSETSVVIRSQARKCACLHQCDN
jgi:hypothetical protein